MAHSHSKEYENIRSKLKRHFGKTLENASMELIYQACALCVRDEIMDEWTRSQENIQKQGKKMLVYMSAEFLMGRALVNNMINLGKFDRYKDALAEMGIDLYDVEEEEDDAALGNGGLGRLAACFLDSLATLELPAMGCGIRYEHGLFKQKILDGAQVEVEDNWLDTGEVWEVETVEEQVEVHFGGEIKEEWTDEGLRINHFNYSTVVAVPYDMPIVGYDSDTPATLRLWSARAKKNLDMSLFNRGDYARAMEEKELAEVISKVLYPEDNHEAGKQLRLKQFYFFTSATIQSLVRRYKKLYGDLHTLPKYIEIQINDTHPTLAIPELMRILMDEEGFSWDDAWYIVGQVFNYTNHTILREALECWPKDMFSRLLPRIYAIIKAINEKYCETLWQEYPGDFEKISQLSIIAYNEIRMAHLCVAACGKINGVSQLHGNILKTQLFRDSYIQHPSKFLAITNGITHRRWLAKANPGLTKLMIDYIGDGFLKDYTQFERLMEYQHDEKFRERFFEIKQQNKKRLADYVLKKQGIVLNTDAIFDTHAKRLHEYKRQLLKVMHIICLYNRILEDPSSFTQPMVFLFAAKASPGYARAKNIIRLINSVAQLVNNDPKTKDILQVVFIENYSVSAAEILIPATDFSEQLSTAGMEASGTGNMKFMMNGAVTIGTMDGANVEIYERVGEENIFIFGATVQEIERLKKFNAYNTGEYYEKDKELRSVLGRLIDGSLPGANDRQFSDLYHSLVFGDFEAADRYFLLHDFRSYDDAFARAVKTYRDKEKWLDLAISNTAMSGIFSSDRTIKDYNDLIWRLK